MIFALYKLAASYEIDNLTAFGIVDADFGDYTTHRIIANRYMPSLSILEKIGMFLGFLCGGVPRYNYHEIKDLKELWAIASQTNRSNVIDPERRLSPWIFVYTPYMTPFFSFLGGVKERSEFGHMEPNSIAHDWFLSYMWNWMICGLTEHSPFIDVVYDSILEFDLNLMYDLTDLLTHYYLCAADLDPFHNCPGACNGKENPCAALGNNDGTCTAFLPDAYTFSIFNINEKNRKKNRERFGEWISKLPGDRRMARNVTKYDEAKSLDLNLFYRRLIKLQKLVVMGTHCRCRLGYIYDTIAKVCKSEFDKLLCGSGNPCKNGGACARRIFENGTESNEIQCRCHPTFQGQYCERKRNPCHHLKAPCGKFPCLRDETLPNGYRCRCPQGFKMKSRHQPQCEDVDDCLAPNTCQNGGTCINRIGTFDCECRKGFEGFRCEIPPPPPQWSAWSEWSACNEPEPAKICDELPYQEQQRMCQVNIIQQRCLGPRRRIRYGCKGKETIDTNLICAKDASETKSKEVVNYAKVDDAGWDESDPPIATRDSSILPAFGDTFFFTIWLIILFIQVYVVWLWSSLLLDFFGPME